MYIFTRFMRLLSGTIPEPRPRPADWNKTFADLEKENRSLSGEEMDWARDYEREQLRGWARFPKDGDVYEALHGLEVGFITYWNGPYSGGGRGTLPAGTQVRVSVSADMPEPIGVQADPVESKRIEELLVSEDDRLSSKYRGYALFLDVSVLNKEFRLVPA
jgi:hypothetical protein